MRKTWMLAAATTLLLPAGLLAQNPPQRQRGMMRRDPVQMVLEQKDTLKLSDAQVKRIQAIQADLQKKNDPLMEKVQAARAKYGNPPTDDERAKMREEMGPMMRELRSNTQTAMDAVLELLDARQQKMVQEMTPRRPGGGERPPASFSAVQRERAPDHLKCVMG